MENTLVFRISLTLGLVLALLSFDSTAQDDGGIDLFEINYESPLTLDLEAEEEVEIKSPKKKKVKKGTFYGVRTKKGFTRTGLEIKVL